MNKPFIHKSCTYDPICHIVCYIFDTYICLFLKKLFVTKLYIKIKVSENGIATFYRVLQIHFLNLKHWTVGDFAINMWYHPVQL